MFLDDSEMAHVLAAAGANLAHGMAMPCHPPWRQVYEALLEAGADPWVDRSTSPTLLQIGAEAVLSGAVASPVWPRLLVTLPDWATDARRLIHTWEAFSAQFLGLPAPDASLPLEVSREVWRRVWLRLRIRARHRLRAALSRARARLERPPTDLLGTSTPTRAQLIAHLRTSGRVFARDYWEHGIPIFFPALSTELGPTPDEFLFPNPVARAALRAHVQGPTTYKTYDQYS